MLKVFIKIIMVLFIFCIPFVIFSLTLIIDTINEFIKEEENGKKD